MITSVQFSSVTQVCLTLCDLMDCRMPGLPVHHQLPEFTQIHVHRVGDAIHLTISSSVIPFSSCLQFFSAWRSFPMSQFTSSGQSTGASALASVFPVNIQDWFPLVLTSLISLLPKGLKSLFQRHSSKVSILQCSAFFMVQFLHPYMTAGKTIALTRWTFVGKVMLLLF